MNESIYVEFKYLKSVQKVVSTILILFIYLFIYLFICPHVLGDEQCVREMCRAHGLSPSSANPSLVITIEKLDSSL